jgi:excisionase family DNA binding protein
MSVTKLSSDYLTVAGAMRVSKMTVYRMVKADAIASVRFGNSYRIPGSAIEEYFRNAGTGPETAHMTQRQPMR